jgi:hypothetical protein
MGTKVNERSSRRYRLQAEPLEGRNLLSAGLATSGTGPASGLKGEAIVTSASSTARAMAARRPVVLRPNPLPGGLGTGLEDATAQIQALIDSTPVNGTLELPRGTYLVSKPIVITKPMTLTTQVPTGRQQVVDPLAGGTLDVSGYATLKASPSLTFGFFYPARDQDKGLLVVHPPVGQDTLSGVHISHIALDGNGDNRGMGRYSNDQMNCSNINMRDTDNSSFTDNVSFHAAHGWDPYADIFVDCTNLKIDDNLLYENGDAAIGTSGPEYQSSNNPSNSLEIQANTRNAHVEVLGNRVYDSTLLGIVMMTGAGHKMSGEVADNQILQFRAMSYGVGLELYGDGSFGDGRIQDPQKTLLVHDNVIDGNAGGATIPGTSTRLRELPYGIMAGEGPFVIFDNTGIDGLAMQIKGGRIYQNQVRNVQVGINVDQAGTVASPTYVVDNTVGGSTGLTYNLAPQVTPGYLPNTIMTNQSIVLDPRGRYRQAGQVRLFTNNSRPASWSDLFTRGSVGGTQEPFRRLIAAAPKTFPSQ